MIITLNEVNFDFDAFDAELVDKRHTALKNYIIQRPEAQTAVESCDLIDVFIDDVLGENAHKSIFQGSRNVMIYAEVITDLLEAVAKQVLESQEATKRINEKMEKIVTMFDGKNEPTLTE